MQTMTSANIEAHPFNNALRDEGPYEYIGADGSATNYAVASRLLKEGRHFERIFGDFAEAATAFLDDHHVVVSGETYVPAGILTDITSDFLTWAQREGLIVVTPKGIAHACFGNL